MEEERASAVGDESGVASVPSAAAVEEEVQHRFATAEPPAPKSWPLFGIPTRRRVLEQRVVGEDADGVLVAVRVEEWFSLR